MRVINVLQLLSILTTLTCIQAFTPTRPTNARISTPSSSSLSAAASSNRDKILSRNGAHFQLNRFSGKVEFGSTVNLITKLPPPSKSSSPSQLESINTWLADEKRVALSIWDETLIKELGQNVYRLQLMTLQFVTIQLAPHVDTKMTTIQESSNNNNSLFTLQSVDFDPNIQLLPGINVPPSSLGIKIEVVGELRPSNDGKGLTGRIGFVSGGDLPPPMRMLPDPILKQASKLICDTVSDFAIKNFERGARLKYKEFCEANDL